VGTTTTATSSCSRWGSRLWTILWESDTVARVGGEGFAVLLPAMDARGAVRVAGKVVQAIEQPFVVEGDSVAIAARPLRRCC
jgi:PleD family two-component response regulator